jgi:hypothetical protein
MNKFSREDANLADSILDEASLNQEDRNTPDTGSESPASATIKVWIDDFGVLLTVREEKVNSLLVKVGKLIDYAKSHGWKPVWNKETTPSFTPSTQPKTSQEECHHANVGQKKSSGYKKPENKDRVYNYCLDCNKFMGWA